MEAALPLPPEGRSPRACNMMDDKQEIEALDRYQALGIPYPDPETMCDGPCEGIGRFPLRKDDDNPSYTGLWQDAEKKCPSDDGWHFVVCPDCNGKGTVNG